MDTTVDGVSTRSGGRSAAAGFTRYTVARDEGESHVVATDGDVLLVGKADWIGRVLSAHAADRPAYLGKNPRARTVLETVGVGPRTVVVTGSRANEEAFSDTAVAEVGFPAIVGLTTERTDERFRFSIAAGYDGAPHAADRRAMKTWASERLGTEPSTEIRDELLVLEVSRPYTPPSERPDVPSQVRFQEYDESTGQVLFEFHNGEDLTVERFEIEVGGSVYDGDWARGQQTIGEGDLIAIDADAISPGDEFTVTYESPDGGYTGSTGTTVLRRLPFTVDFDPDEHTGVLEYVEGPPLQADRLHLTVDEDGRKRRPWTGTVTEGETITLRDLPLSGTIEVGYERADGRAVTIGYARFAPPGEFSFDYDGTAETLTITYPDPEDEVPEGDRPAWATEHRTRKPLDPSRYRIRVAGTPAATQWSDQTGPIEPGDAVTLSEVPVGTTVDVAWLDQTGSAHVLDETVTMPTVSFSFAYDADASTLTITHASGQAVAAEKLSIRLMPEERTVPWTGTKQVEQGDALTVENVGKDAFLVIEYAGRGLAHQPVRELLDEEQEAEGGGTPATPTGSVTPPL